MANRLFALAIFLLCILSFAKAQKNTDSPYSRNGIGLLNTTQNIGNFALGGSGVAWRPFQYKPLIYDSLAKTNQNLRDRGTNSINIVNPASISNISLTTFEFSAVSRNAQSISGDQTKTSTSTQFGHMSLAAPLGEKAALAFGIRPFSFVGYDYTNSSTINNESVDYVYEGSGGVNEIFFGAGYEFLKNVSVGVTGSYYFGELTDNRRVVYNSANSGFFNSLDERTIRVNSLAYTVGVQYFKHINDKYRIVLGAVLSPIDELNAEDSRVFRNYTGIPGLENFADTGLFNDQQKIKLATAAVLGLGGSFEYKQKWMLTADVKLNTWGDVAGQNIVGVQPGNGQSVHVGFDKYVNSSTFGSYLNKVGYRVGARYNSAVVKVDEQDVSEFGISFGLSLPLRKTFSTMNVGAEVGQRGEDANGLVRENFFNLQLGVTINDKWFIKRQYD